MKPHKRNKWGKVIGLALLGLGAIESLGNIAQNPNVALTPRLVGLRLIRRQASSGVVLLRHL